MKYYIILAILIIKSLLAFPNYSDDFGFRLSLGGISGINNKVYPEVSAVTHFYCFSNNFRMVFDQRPLFQQIWTHQQLFFIKLALNTIKPSIKYQSLLESASTNHLFTTIILNLMVEKMVGLFF